MDLNITRLQAYLQLYKLGCEGRALNSFTLARLSLCCQLRLCCICCYTRLLSGLPQHVTSVDH